MRHRKLALRYARALLEALPEAADREAAERFLTALGEAIATQNDLREMIADPAVPRDARKKVLRATAEIEGVPDRVANFLDVVVDNGRAAALPEIAEAFHAEWEASEGIVPARVTTAKPLPEDLRERIRATLEKITGKKIRLACGVEPSLIGGAVARVGSVIYDGSLRTQLDRLRQRMAEE